MTKIKDVTIGFNCPETLDKKLFCGKCSNRVIDFTNKTDKELREEIKESKGIVCGLFKKSQLSEQFLKYAAATVITTSLAIPTLGQNVVRRDSLIKACAKIEMEQTEEFFLGTIVETVATPLGGYEEFFKTIANEIYFPSGLTTKGKSFIEFTVDTLGQMTNVKLIKGFHDQADQEACRVLISLNYRFTPARQRGKAVKQKMVIPITFDPEKKIDR